MRTTVLGPVSPSLFSSLPHGLSSTAMTPILLLRSPSQDIPDRYHAAFSPGYTPISIPVLETAHANIDEIQSIISDGPHAHSLRGVVITSQRACVAWQTATQNLLTQDESDVNVVSTAELGP